MADSSEIQALLKQADEAVARNEIDVAIQLCQQAIALDARSVPAYTKLAELHVAKGQPAEASQQYLTIAKAYYDSKLMKGAMKYYQRVVELDANCLEARQRLVEIYEAESMDRESKLEALKVAELYLQAGDLNQAEATAQKAIALKSIEARYVLGLVYYRREMWKEAASELTQLTKFKPNHVEALVHLGLAAVKSGQPLDAIQAFEKARKIKAGDLMVLECLADAYAGKNMAVEAQQACEELAEAAKNAGDASRGKKAVQTLVALAAAATKNHDMDRARTVYQKALMLDPECEEAKSGLSKMETVKAEAKPEPKPEAKGAPARPAAPAAAAPKASPAPAAAPAAAGNFAARFAKADELLKTAMYQEAIDILRDLTKEDPANMDVRRLLHQAYLLASQQDQPAAPPPVKAAAGPAKDPQKPTVEKKKGVKISYL